MKTVGASTSYSRTPGTMFQGLLLIRASRQKCESYRHIAVPAFYTKLFRFARAVWIDAAGHHEPGLHITLFISMDKELTWAMLLVKSEPW